MKNTINMLRKLFLFSIVLFFFSSFFNQLQAQYVYNKLVWFDEFDEKENMPDSTKWGYDNGDGCPQICGWGNNELQYYTTSRLNNARVQNGKLIIEALKEDFNGAKYTSARMVTKKRGDWKYGRIEINAKMPAGRGVWPAIWMLPTNWEYGIWPLSGEIDIMENVGYWPDSLFGTVHTEDYNGMKGTQKVKSKVIKDLSTAFHLYAIEWTENEISFYIDGNKYHSFANNKTGFKAWPFDKEFYLVMNIAVGGNWGGKYGIDDAIFPQKMEVDYVRVYQ
jgi:hypothetical protein